MDNPIQGGVRAVLRELDAGFPRVETMTAPEVRAAVADRRVPTAKIDDVRGTTDFSLPGPDGDIPARSYPPHGDPGRSRPGIVVCHGGGFVLCDIDSHDALTPRYEPGK